VHVVGVNGSALDQTRNLFALHNPAVGVAEHSNQRIDKNELGQERSNHEVYPEENAVVAVFIAVSGKLTQTKQVLVHQGIDDWEAEFRPDE